MDPRLLFYYDGDTYEEGEAHRGGKIFIFPMITTDQKYINFSVEAICSRGGCFFRHLGAWKERIEFKDVLSCGDASKHVSRKTQLTERWNVNDGIDYDWTLFEAKYDWWGRRYNVWWTRSRHYAHTQRAASSVAHVRSFIYRLTSHFDLPFWFQGGMPSREA